MPPAPALLPPFGRRLLIGLLALLDFAVAVVKRPSQLTHHLDFEGLSTTCDFSAAPAILKDEYTTRLVTFSGPGFGGLNGGVAMDRCALSSGNFPPLNNASVAGTGFLGFSTLHAFVGRTGKPISPETVRFDVRMTNILASFSGLDGHSVTIELWSGPGDSFDDEGELLQTYTLPMTATLQSFKLVDEADIFVDCVRRMTFTSPSKIFILDDLRYDVSSADDGLCGAEPGREAPSSPPPSDSAAAGAPRGGSAAALVGTAAASSLALLLTLPWRQRQARWRGRDADDERTHL